LPEVQLQRSDTASSLAERYAVTRALSEALVAPLSEADATLQSMPDASPAKWHLAHTTWFFETFVLRDRASDYRLYDEQWPFLFNSYYETEGERIARPRRGMLSRPTLPEILGWRTHVDEAMQPLLADPAHAALIELGIAHEQQHQELLLTDIKHALFQNPLGPAYLAEPPQTVRPERSRGALACEAEAASGAGSRLCSNLSLDFARDERGWWDHPGGIALIGHQGAGFAFDNEGPPHRVLLEPFALAGRLVSNGEWGQFIADGGYSTASLWLSEGWDWVRREAIAAPEYWREDEQFTHAGWQPRDPAAPVCHVSYYEADAFAAWAGARLPTEFEWEAIGQGHDPASGRQLDDAGAPLPCGTASLFGDCWQFTRSAYLPYPRFAPAAGAVGEYNGKFMAGQWVLKGASCATVRGHSRASYRNFFYPQQRWQFTGLRLARDL
jgi:ergothioneine biosynthesis protein EgtB